MGILGYVYQLFVVVKDAGKWRQIIGVHLSYFFIMLLCEVGNISAQSIRNGFLKSLADLARGRQI